MTLNDRGHRGLADAFLLLAKTLDKFDEEELSNLSLQVNCYQVMDDTEIPEYDATVDRLDHFWRKVFRVVEIKMEAKPVELIKLIKILCSLSHGNGGIERGFAVTKYLVMLGRPSVMRV